MKIIITGSTGQIGSVLSSNLSNQAHQLYPLVLSKLDSLSDNMAITEYELFVSEYISSFVESLDLSSSKDSFGIVLCHRPRVISTHKSFLTGIFPVLILLGTILSFGTRVRLVHISSITGTEFFSAQIPLAYHLFHSSIETMLQHFCISCPDHFWHVSLRLGDVRKSIAADRFSEEYGVIDVDQVAYAVSNALCALPESARGSKLTLDYGKRMLQA